MRGFILFFILLLSACTPLINVSINNSQGEGKHSIKGESELTPTATTKTAIPVSVGAQPTATTGAVK